MDNYTPKIPYWHVQRGDDTEIYAQEDYKLRVTEGGALLLIEVEGGDLAYAFSPGEWRKVWVQWRRA